MPAVRPSPVRKSLTSPAEPITPPTVSPAPVLRLPPLPPPPKEDDFCVTPARAFLRGAIITIGSDVTRACTTETAGAAVGAKAFADLHTGGRGAARSQRLCTWGASHRVRAALASAGRPGPAPLARVGEEAQRAHPRKATTTRKTDLIALSESSIPIPIAELELAFDEPLTFYLSGREGADKHHKARYF